jgi:hypothetical protein
MLWIAACLQELAEPYRIRFSSLLRIGRTIILDLFFPLRRTLTLDFSARKFILRCIDEFVSDLIGLGLRVIREICGRQTPYGLARVQGGFFR